MVQYWSEIQMHLDRQIQIRVEDRAVRQTWRKHSRGWLLTSSLLRKGTKKEAGKALCSVVADDAALIEKGREHVETIRERFETRETEGRCWWCGRCGGGGKGEAQSGGRGPLRPTGSSSRWWD